MSDAKEFDKWLRDAARSPSMQERLARADAQPDLPEEVLADYYAGELSPAEQQLVERRIAVSETMGRFLAELDADVAEATPPAPPRPVFATFFARAAHFINNVLPSPNARRLAVGMAGVVLVIGVTSRVLDRPPGGLGPEYGMVSPRGAGELQELALPGGTVGLVDPEWPLHQPIGNVSGVRWFAWDPARGAASYGFELRDAGGHVMYSTAGLNKSVFRLPWSVRRSLAHDVLYTWIVTAVDASGAPQLRAVGKFKIE
jgi:hypothetical protein